MGKKAGMFHVEHRVHITVWNMTYNQGI